GTTRAFCAPAAPRSAPRACREGCRATYLWRSDRRRQAQAGPGHRGTTCSYRNAIPRHPNPSGTYELACLASKSTLAQQRTLELDHGRLVALGILEQVAVHVVGQLDRAVAHELLEALRLPTL